jgi:hypothetical protein
MASLDDMLTTAKNIVTAINGVSQTYLNVNGSRISANITAATLLKTGSGRVAMVSIIVGGPFFMAHPEQAADVGADLVVNDASLAPELVQRHIAGASPTQQSCAFNH